MNDPYELPAQEYNCYEDIIEKLYDIQNEDVTIISEMYAEASWDSKDYYWTDTACNLEEKMREIFCNGDKDWLFYLAVEKFRNKDFLNAHDFIYYALIRDDLCQILQFDKLLVKHFMPNCELSTKQKKELLKDVKEELEEEIKELDRFDYDTCNGAFIRAMKEHDIVRVRHRGRDERERTFERPTPHDLLCQRRQVLRRRSL